jgi:hypothetical protein
MEVAANVDFLCENRLLRVYGSGDRGMRRRLLGYTLQEVDQAARRFAHCGLRKRNEAVDCEGVHTFTCGNSNLAD